MRKSLLEKEKACVSDKFLQKALSRLRENYFKKREYVQRLFDIESMRNRTEHIKQKAIEHLEENIEKLQRVLRQRNIEVVYANNTSQANRAIKTILNKHRAKHVIKAKSLTTEEIGLNEYLKGEGFTVTETDLGEWLVQLNNESPTHMTAPAIHMPRERVRELLQRSFNVTLSDDVENLTAFAREKIKESLSKAEAGIIGANAVSSESGTFFLVSNEGNIQHVLSKQCTICLIGIDKIVSTDSDAFEIVQILPKAATGQITTSYIDILKHPPAGKFYVILLDNGRTAIRNDSFMNQILRCIHCGACQNACPVYTTVGGSLFRGKAYAGPIGILLSYLAGETDNLWEYANMCIGCMACDEICSSRIELQRIILTLKARYKTKTEPIKGLIIKHLENNYSILRLGALIMHFVFKKAIRTGIKPIDEYLGVDFRALPGIKPSFDIVVKTEEADIGLFAGCSTNFIYHEIGEAALSVAKKLNLQVKLIHQKACCGAPAWYNGEEASANRAARINVKYIMSLNLKKLLFLDPHCAHMFERDYKFLYPNKESKQLSEMVTCASTYFIETIEQRGYRTSRLAAALGYHHPCHLKRGLKHSNRLEAFLKTNEPNFVELKDSDRCCGFAGSYSMMHPHISKKLLEEKLDAIKEARISVLVTACPGCIMQIAGGASKRRMHVEILHFVSYLDRII